RRYFRDRGLGEETISRLEIGLAPGGWEGLLNYLRRQGFTSEEMVKAGLAARSRKGKGCYDWFRNRIMFPIQRLGGGFIGFGGRVLGDGEPKYLNSPETPIFSKGKQLYGLSWSRDAIRAAGCAVIVEGYMDFASLWEAGVRNVAAVLGTGFTPEHARLLSRFTQTVVLNFDSDQAGRRAAARALAVLLDEDFQVRVLELPGAKDPDEFVRSHGAESYLEAAATAPGSVKYLIKQAEEGKDLSLPEDRARAVSALLPHIRTFRNRVLQAAALGQVAHHFDLPEAAVRQEFARLARPDHGSSEAPAAPGTRPRPRLRLAERQLLRLLVDDPAARKKFLDQVKREDFAGLGAERLFVAMLAEYQAGGELSVISLGKVLVPEDRQELMEIVLSEHPAVGDGQWEECWKTLQREKLERESRRLHRQLQQQMEGPGGSGGIDDLLRRKLDIRRAIDALS
ncbi:MAG: DNA primase, partial [Acidobacteriota bacterium]